MPGGREVRRQGLQLRELLLYLRRLQAQHAGVAPEDLVGPVVAIYCQPDAALPGTTAVCAERSLIEEVPPCVLKVTRAQEEAGGP